MSRRMLIHAITSLIYDDVDDDELSLVVVMMVVITTSELFDSQITLSKLHLGLSCFRMVFLIQGK